jgi:hypothetical protein
MRKSTPTGPLTPAVFHILLALCDRERHSYDIMQQVKEGPQGAVKMGPGTLWIARPQDRSRLRPQE